MITLIAAVDSKKGIGKNNTIPWNLKRDLRLFQRETVGGAVIMGRKTFESIGSKPLKDRLNIVVSASLCKEQLDIPEVVFVTNLPDALKEAHKRRFVRVYGIGGRKIYESLMPMASRIVLSHVEGDFDCDVKFPFYENKDWFTTTVYREVGFRIQELISIPRKYK